MIHHPSSTIYHPSSIIHYHSSLIIYLLFISVPLSISHRVIQKLTHSIPFMSTLTLQDRDRETALMKAAYYGHRQLLQLLVERKADLNHQVHHHHPAPITHHPSGITHQPSVSSTLHPLSSIPHFLSYIPYPLSSMPYLLILYPSPLSSIIFFSSIIRLPSSISLHRSVESSQEAHTHFFPPS